MLSGVPAVGSQLVGKIVHIERNIIQIRKTVIMIERKIILIELNIIMMELLLSASTLLSGEGRGEARPETDCS